MNRRTFLQSGVGLSATTGVSLTNFASAFHAVEHPLSYPSTTFQFTSKGKPVKVHAVSTGAISVKQNFISRKGAGVFSKLNVLFSNSYTRYLPIWVWVIEHPEGIFVIDTGDIEEANHKDFYKNESAMSRFNLLAMSNKRLITREDEIDQKLLSLGIQVSDVSKVVITHLHADHTDGLKFFPRTPILVHDKEYKNPYANLPTTYPPHFNPTLVQLKSNEIALFDAAFALTTARDCWMVYTPGHTHHHCSVLLQCDNINLLFGGDLCYQREQLVTNTLSAAHVNPSLALRSYSQVRQFALQHPTIFLPSHDPACVVYLDNNQTLTIAGKTERKQRRPAEGLPVCSDFLQNS